MKKAVFNKRGTRQIVRTGYDVFDRQTNCIITGNAICNTQVSSFIRPYSQQECNGMMFQQGHLLKTDLEWFTEFTIPQSILDVINDRERKESIILYMFHTTHRQFGIQPFLWVVTDRSHKLIEQRVVSTGRQWIYKRIAAAMEILQYITE